MSNDVNRDTLDDVIPSNNNENRLLLLESLKTMNNDKTDEEIKGLSYPELADYFSKMVYKPKLMLKAQRLGIKTSFDFTTEMLLSKISEKEASIQNQL